MRYANVPTITTQPAAATKSSGQSYTFSVTPSASGAVTGDWTYQWRKNGVNIAGATAATYTISNLVLADAGTYSVVVKSSGSSGAVSTVTSADAVLTMNKGSQTITFGTLADRVYGAAAFTVTATDSASLITTFTSNATAVCTVGAGTLSGNDTTATVTIVANGTCSLTASQAGDTNYNAATSVTQTFAVAQKQLTITGMTAGNKVYDRSTAATVSFASATLNGVVSGDTVGYNSGAVSATFADKTAADGKTVTATGIVLNGAQSSRYTLADPTATANITKAPLTITGVTANNKVYDRTVTATLVTTSAALSGVIGADTVTLSKASAAGTFADKTAATGKAVTTTGFSISGADSANYSLTQPSTTADITKAPLTVTGVTANNRTYDRTTNATSQLVLGSAALSGVIGADTVTISTAGATGSFATKIAETGKTVTVAGITIGGADAGNYSLSQPTTTASILQADLTITGVTASNKVYDRTVTATLVTTSAALSGVIGADTVTLSKASAAGTFATKIAENAKIVTTTGFSISGADSANYNLVQPTTTADITKAPLTITGVTASNKVYDRTVTATLVTTSAALSGVIGADTVTLSKASAAGTFADKTAATGKAVTTTGFSISGADSANYSLTQPSTTADITKAPLTVTGTTASNKVYDRTVTATLDTTSSALSGVIGADVVTLSKASAAGTFADKSVADGKTVTITGFSIGGADSANYDLSQPTATANITKATLTVTGVTANNKNYDGTTTAVINTGSAAFSGKITGDTVTINVSSATGTFSSAAFGTGKTVQIAGITADGADAGNYAVTQPTTTADISKRTLTVSGITASSRTYDGTTEATSILNVSSAALQGVQNNDSISLSTTNAAGAFADKNHGTGKSIQVSGLTISGTNAANYDLVQPTVTGSITKKSLTMTGITASNKVYDSSASATSLLDTSAAALSGVVSGDNVTFSTAGITGAFADKNIGTAKTITISGITIGGTDAGNYSFSQPTRTANITTRTLTVVNVTANDKVYDASTSATALLNLGTAALSGVQGSDALTVVTSGATATFANKNIGTNKQVTIAGITATGTEIGNYTLVQPSTTASITARTLTVLGVSANNKTYDRDVSATALLNLGTATLSGVQGSDDVTLVTSGASASFADYNIGTGKAVTITGITVTGGDIANYDLVQPGTTATITAKTLTVSGVTANARTYDRTTSATSLVVMGSAQLVGVVQGDSISIDSTGLSASFATKTVGTNKQVTITGLALSGTNRTNYSLTQPTTTASITQKDLTVTGITASNKVYDSATPATISTSSAALVGVVGADDVTLVTSSAAGAFTDRNFGTGKTVNISGLTVSGNDTANYNLIQPSTTADITKRNLTVLGVTAANRVYDRTSGATALLNLGTAVLSGVQGSDSISIDTSAATATFADKNVGNGKTVTVAGISFTGTQSANYTITQPTATADITAKSLTVTGVTAGNRTYDRTVSATALLNLGTAAFSGVIAGDDVTIDTSAATATFADKNVGNGKTVTVAGIGYTGNDRANYSITQPTTTANISAKTVTVTGITAATRIFDNTTAATLDTTNAVLQGAVTNDDVALDASGAVGTFNDKTVATGKTVYVSGLTLTGNDRTNYSLTQPTTTADILTASAGLAWTAPSDIVYGTVLGSTQLNATANVAGTFIYSPAAGTRLAVGTHQLTVSFTPTNTAYDPDTATVSITVTRKQVTIAGVTVVDKTYDASTSATTQLRTGSAQLSGLESGDIVTLDASAATATWTSRTAGNNKTVNTAGFTIAGSDAGNYSLVQPSTTASILKRALTVSGVTANDRVYNASNSATALLNLNSAAFVGIQGADDVTIDTSAATATFANKNIGTNKQVTVAGITFTGNDTGNYTITQPTTTATITARTLFITGITVADKIYDATADTTDELNTSSPALSGVVNGDTVILHLNGFTATYADKNIGTNKTVTTAGATIDGTDAANYNLVQPQLSASITPRTLTVIGVSANNRTYDRTTSATALLNLGTATLVGIQGADDITITTNAAAATFANKTIGTNKPVTITGIGFTGTDAGNYTITQPSTTASITAKNLTVSGVTANDRVYNASNSATALLNLNSAAFVGIQGADDVTIDTSAATATFANKNIGTNKQVTVAGITFTGNDTGNYTITQPTTTATITARTLFITGITVADKIYDATADTTDELNTSSPALSGVVNGDTVILHLNGFTATYADKNIGTNKTVTTAGATIDGTDAANYNLVQPQLSASITPRTLTVIGVSANNRTYDRTTSATALLNLGTATLVGIQGADDITITTNAAAATFANKTIGTNKPVTITGIGFTGTDAGNYTITQPSTTASITAKNLTVTGITVADKVYDGTTTGTPDTNAAAFNGIVGADQVLIDTTAVTATFAGSDVGQGIGVSIAGVAKSGNDAGNYTITQPSTTASISRASAQLAWTNPAGITFGTNLSATQLNATAAVAGTFAYTPDTGTRLGAGTHQLSVTFTPDSANYAVATRTVNISVAQRPLGIATNALTVTYGASYSSSFTPTGVSAPDSTSSVIYTYQGTNGTTYAASTTPPVHAGTYSVLPSALSLSAGQLSNYSVTYTAATLTINKAAQPANTAHASATTVTYTPAPSKTTVALSISGGAGDGTVSYAVTSGSTYCSVSGSVLTAENAGQCTVVATRAEGTDHLTADSAPITITIDRADQTVALAAIGNRTYGDADVTVSATATSGLTPTISASPANVCTVASGLTVHIVANGTCTVVASQAGDSNWNTATPDQVVGSTRSFQIARKNLTITGAAANDRTYDSTASATALVDLTGAALSGPVGSDSVAIDPASLSATFATKSIGTNKPITVTGIALSGAQASRYTVSQPGYLAADVTPATLTVSGITVPTRAYDGTRTALLDTGAYLLSGVIASDVVRLDASAYTATYSGAGAQAGRVVTVTNLLLSGDDAGNYTLVQPTLTGDIVKAAGTITFATSRTAVYDGTPRALASTTNPSALSVNTLYAGTSGTVYAPTTAAPVNAGSYNVNATILDANYEGTASSGWTVTKQVVGVSLDQASLTHEFNGRARSVAASTSPAGRNTMVTYTGRMGTVYSSAWPPTNAGTYTVTGTVQEQNFQGTVSETLTIERTVQSPITFVSANSTVHGTAHQLVATGGSGSGVLTYERVSGPCAVDTATGMLSTTGAGQCVVRALRAGSTNYVDAQSANHTVTIARAPQTVQFTSQIPSSPVKDSVYSPTATSSSGLSATVTITVGNGNVCMMLGNDVKFLASGTCEISAAQSGDQNWLAASTAVQHIEVGRLNQSIVFPQPAARVLGEPDFAVDASASSGLTVDFQVTAGQSACAVSSTGIVTIRSVGSCSITASQQGDTVFAAASTVTRTLSILPALPSAPHIASISSGDSTLTVGIIPPSTDGGATITAYQLTAESSSAPTVVRSDCAPSALSCTLVGLENSTTYTITLAAVNSRGTGPLSETAEVVTPAPTLSAVRNVAGTRATTNLDVRWEDPATFGTGTFVRYEVSIRERSGTYGNPVTVQSLARTMGIRTLEPIARATTTTGRNVTFTNLDPSKTYETKIVTITTTESNEVSDNTANALMMPLAVPSAPRALTVESTTGMSARVAWNIPEIDGGSPLLRYTVTVGGHTCALSNMLDTSCTVSGLQPGDPLNVSVTATNAVGTSIAAVWSQSLPTVPGTPGTGVITTGATTATVNWAAPASNGGRPITSYSVIATEANNTANVFRCTAATTSCTVTGLKSLTSYLFRVRATNSVGSSQYSSDVRFDTGRPETSDWDVFRRSAGEIVATAYRLPPSPAKVTSTALGARTKVVAVRALKDASIPVTHAFITVTSRSGRLLARIKVQVDPSNPATSVSVPYASSKVRISVQFANAVGLSSGGPANLNVSEGTTLEWTTVGQRTELIGNEVADRVDFKPGSTALTYAMTVRLKRIAATVKSRGGLVYVTAFSQQGESKSAWLLEPLARARAEKVARYLSRLGVRQWITFQGSRAATDDWGRTRARSAVISTSGLTEP